MCRKEGERERGSKAGRERHLLRVSCFSLAMVEGMHVMSCTHIHTHTHQHTHTRETVPRAAGREGGREGEFFSWQSRP